MTSPEGNVAMTGIAASGAAALAALDRLADVLARENAALRARDVRAVEALAEEKRAAADECERLVSTSAARGETGGGAAPFSENALPCVMARLAALVEENQWRLRVAKQANQRLVETIAVAAQAQAPGAGVYASDGRKDFTRGRKNNPPALTFSRFL